MTETSGSRPLYDSIGRGYARARVPDPRIAAQIHAALGDARRVVNVGAGAGSYEPRDRVVIALEPSPVMIGQRPATGAPAVVGTAEALPFPDGAFDAALASLTLHHWSDLGAGIAELRRVAPRIVVFTFDVGTYPWIVTEYLPEAYLDPDVRAGMSAMQTMDQDLVESRMDRLAADLASGAWDERHGHLRDLDELDVGLCLLITR